MNILWITNIPIGKVATEIYHKPMAGLWMDAMLNQLQNKDDNRFVIATTVPNKQIQVYHYDGIAHYLLPGNYPVYYKRGKCEAKTDWRDIFEKEKIDAVQVWGTEYAHAVPALEVAKDLHIPSVIYIQGMMEAISHYATGLLPLRTMLRYTTLRDLYRGQMWAFQNKWFQRGAKVEKDLLKLSGSVIVENNWAEMFCKSVNPNLKVFRIPLSINEVFFKEEWSHEKMEPYTILSNASGPAYKGTHILLKALVLVKKQYPDVKLYIPGGSLISHGLIARQKARGYCNYITDIIKKYDLTDNVQFTGYLTQTQLAKKLSEVNVFVLPSAIENHSSSLKEAMAVGTPSVASQVGGVPEYFEYGKCGFSYRYEEYECLAGYICKMFANKDQCQRFSESERATARLVNDEDITKLTIEMYRCLNNKK